MYIDKFNIEKLDYRMCAAFTGCKYDKLTEQMYQMMEKAEKDILKTAKPKAVYEIFDIEEIDFEGGQVLLKGNDFKLTGNSICNHLKDFEKVVFLATTLGADVDRLIKKQQIVDLSYACFLDGMAGVMIETVCDNTTAYIKESMNINNMTYRFGLGYGDLPISLEHDFLRLLNANALIGLNSTESYLLTPCKSVACVIGIN